MKDEVAPSSVKDSYAEEEIRRVSEEWKRIFDAITDFMFVIDKDYRFVRANKALCNVLKKEPKELIGKRCFEVLHGTDKPWPNCPHKRTLTTKKVATEEINDPNLGLPLLVTNSPIFDGAGELVGAVHLAKDITKRKMAEDALRKSENKSRTLLENLPQKIFFKNRKSVYIAANENYARDLKIKSDEIAGRTDYDFFPKKLAEKYRADDKRIMESGKTDDIDEEYVQNGQKVFVHTVKTPFKDEKGNVVGVLGIFWDITERKKAEEELRETKDYLDNLLNYANAPIIVWDNENKISLFNNAFEVLTGYKKESVLGRNIDVLFPPLQKEEILQTIEKATKGEKWQSVEVPILCKGKETRIALWNSANITDKEGKTVATIAQGQDITERKQAEEALKESEGKLMGIFESAPDPIAVSSLDAKIIDCNSAALKTFGYSTKSEVIGSSVFDFFAEKERARAAENLAREGEDVRNAEYIFQAKNGREFPGELSSSPVLQPSGEITFFVSTIKDITERKQMREKLKQYSEHLEALVQKRTKELSESQKNYSVLVEEANVGVATLRDGKIVFVNKKGEEIVGCSRDELIGLPFMKLVSEEYRQIAMERYAQRIKGESAPATYEIEVNAKNGEHIPIEISAAHISYQGRPADLILVRDIRERKRMEEQRSKLERLASIGELAAMIGHDLRNPLQAIENATYYLKNEYTRMSSAIPPKTNEMLQVIDNSVNYADKIVRDLSDFSVTKKPSLKRIDINMLIKETLSQVEAPKNVEISTELSQLPEIEVDENQMKRVFLNLIANGIQAMENGGTLTVSTQKAEGFVEISFKDTGVGIPQDNMDKMFSPFFTTKAKGMGVGLAICKKFVESHDGTIHVESEVGKGTTFTVKLPIRHETEVENVARE